MKTAGLCLSGCVRKGWHTTSCEEREDVCKGCLPKDAEFGHLCAWCWQRLHADVIDAAPLVRHLRVMAEPHAGTRPPGDGRSQADAAEGSILSAAVDAADDVHAGIAAYAQLVLEEHPSGRQMKGPDERGVVITKTTIHSDDYGTYVQKATAMGIRDAEATARLTSWLLPMLGWCAEQDWAGVMRSELSALIRTTMARWPMQDTRTRAVNGVMCTSCGRASLVYTPTSGPRLPFHVACTHPDCARTYTEEEYDGAIGRLAIERGYVA